MIRFGPSGIPLSCKGRTLLDGVSDVHKLGLTALEVQFLRMNARTTPVDVEDEVGLKARDVKGKLIIGVNRGFEYKNIFMEDLDKVLEPGDMIHFLKGGVAEEFHRFSKIGYIGKEIDVKLTLHTPYYMKFTDTEGDLVKKSKLAFKYSTLMGAELGADMVVTHPGLMEVGETTDDVRDKVIKNMRKLRDWINKNFEDGPLIGLETQMGKDVFGSLDDILSVCKKISGTQPILNLANIKARGEYPLEDPDDFQEIFDLCKNITGRDYYINFSGIEKRRNEYRFTPIKRGELSFEPLAENLVYNEDDFTIISTSPLKEHDAMYMRVIFERNYSKEIGKELRRKLRDG